MVEATPFGDFNFQYHAASDQDPLAHIGESGFDDNGVEPFAGSHRMSVSSMPDRPESIAALARHSTDFEDLGSDRRPSTLNPSDDGSPGSDGAGAANSLEDPIADEFGLSSHGPGDATDLGGKSKDDKMDLAPAWSELKTKAGKERKRLPLACIACRRKKIRCSGEKPACKHCVRSRIPCVYKVTTRKAAPRTDYMAMLDKRLKRMEERIIKIVPKNEQDPSSSSVTRAVVKPAIPGTLTAAKATTKKRPADEAFGPDLDHWARAPSKAKADRSAKPTSLQIQEAEENKLFHEGSDALPSNDIQEHLAEVFFENIYGQAYHILHKPSFMRKLRMGTLPPVLVLSVCSVAARFSTHPKLGTLPNFLRGEEWASHARDICMRRYEWPNITILTCLLILGLHEFGTCHGGRSWALGGQAIRMAFALQLHRDVEFDPRNGTTQLSFIDREIRRRTMWACFLMDRFNSSGTDRPTFIKEETVKIPLPIKEKYFQLDMPAPTETLHGNVLQPASPDYDSTGDVTENMGVAAYMIRAIALWGRIINYLNQGGKELDPHPMWSAESEYSKLNREAEEALANLPDSLKYTSDNLRLHDTENMANQFLFLHISMQQNVLFMNRVALSIPGGPSPDVTKAFVSKAYNRTFAAANRVSEILKDAESYFVTAPFVGYCAFSSSTIHILGIFSGSPAIEASSKRNLATNVKFLSKMKRYWGMFHWMSENLREQYRTYADNARQGAQANDNNAASPIFQYGDWFDRYPHGVSQADFVDPAIYKKKEKGDEAVLEQKPELHTVEEFFTKLSPPQSAENKETGGVPPAAAAAAAATARAVALKRKALGKRPSGSLARSDSALEPLLTDFNAASASASDLQLSARLQQQQHARRFSGALGGQASAAAGFNPLNIPHTQSASSYHALSPVSPVTVGNPFGPHHAHPNAGFYPDLLSMSLAHPANNIIQPLDRQLVFGAYGMEPGLLDGTSGIEAWDGLATGAPGASRHESSAAMTAAAVAAQRRARGALNGGLGRGGAQAHRHAHAHPDLLAGAFGGPEASSAWFMPFNMEPPEIGHDLGLGGMGNMDTFGGVFGTGGPSTPNGLNNMHHGH